MLKLLALQGKVQTDLGLDDAAVADDDHLDGGKSNVADATDGVDDESAKSLFQFFSLVFFLLLLHVLRLKVAEGCPFCLSFYFPDIVYILYSVALQVMNFFLGSAKGRTQIEVLKLLLLIMF